MSEFGEYNHNDQTAMKVRVDKFLKTRHEDRSQRFLITTADSAHPELVIWDVSPAFDVDWQLGDWYLLENIFVKKWDSAVELESSSDTTAVRIKNPNRNKPAEHTSNTAETHSDRNEDNTSYPEIPPNELADWYEALSAMHESLPSETHPQWKNALESILFGGKHLGTRIPCYGEQQANRNGFKLDDYRALYGDGDRVREFPAIEVSEPRKPDRQYVDDSLRVPTTPESDTVLPILVDDDGLLSAISLLREFPAAPTAESPGNIKEPLLDPGLADAISFSPESTDSTSASYSSKRANEEHVTLPPNELAELYDALYALFESISEMSHPIWSKAIESVIFGGEFLRSSTVPYGTQQSENNDFSISDYRDQYGNGDRVIDFHKIETVTKPADEDHHDDAVIRCPVTPDSKVPLPVAPAMDELPQALRLLNELPAAPHDGYDSSGGESLLKIKPILASIPVSDGTSTSTDSGTSSSTGAVSTESDQMSTQSESVPSSENTTQAGTADTDGPEPDEAATDSQSATSDTTVLRSETAAESNVPLSQAELAGDGKTRKYEDPAAEYAHRRAQRRDPSDVVGQGEEITLTLKEVDYSSRPPTIMGSKNSLAVFVIDAPQDLSKYDTIRAKVVDFGGKNNSAEAAFLDYVD